jgi:uncharacterized ion transporter superfamily protein YfcC
MNLNDIFVKLVLVSLIASIIFFVVVYYGKTYKDPDNTNLLTENEKQILKDYFKDNNLKDTLDKAYLDNITEIYNKNINILINEINRLNQLNNNK